MKNLQSLKEEYERIRRREVALESVKRDRDETLRRLERIEREVVDEEQAVQLMWCRHRSSIRQTGTALSDALMDTCGEEHMADVVCTIFNGADHDLAVQVSKEMVAKLKGSVTVETIVECLESLICGSDSRKLDGVHFASDVEVDVGGVFDSTDGVCGRKSQVQ